MEGILGRGSHLERQLGLEGAVENRMLLDKMVRMGVEAEAVPVVFRSDGASDVLADGADGDGRAVKILRQELCADIARDVALGVGFADGRLDGRDPSVENRDIIRFGQLGSVVLSVDDGHGVEIVAEHVAEGLHAAFDRSFVLFGRAFFHEGLIVGVSPDVEHFQIGLAVSIQLAGCASGQHEAA